jgi:hypothetical protein
MFHLLGHANQPPGVVPDFNKCITLLRTLPGLLSVITSKKEKKRPKQQKKRYLQTHQQSPLPWLLPEKALIFKICVTDSFFIWEHQQQNRKTHE